MDSLTCITCQVNFGIYPASSTGGYPTCVSCVHDNCNNCSQNNYYQCTSCVFGYFLNVSSCPICPTPCSSCINEALCLTC